LEPKYPTNASYAGQTIDDIFSEQQMEGAVVHEMRMLESVLLRNSGDGSFAVEPLPGEAQTSPVYGMLIRDLDTDGVKDVLLGGNLHKVKPSIGRYDASYGTFLRGTGDGPLQVVEARDSGLALTGEIRDFVWLGSSAEPPRILAIRNDDTMQVLELLNNEPD
jgi:hypothetical protein